MRIRAIVDKSTLVHDSQSYWRVDLPFAFMKRYDIDVDTVSLDEEIPINTDILILPKIAVVPEDRDRANASFEKMKAQGTTFVYDVDDDLWSSSFVQYMTKLHLQLGKKIDTAEPMIVNAVIQELQKRADNSMWVMQQCDAVTTSTKALQDAVKIILPKTPVLLLENAIDVYGIEDRLDKERSLVHPHYTTLGWAGGARVQEDLANMLGAWNRIAFLREDVKFVIAGWTPDLQKYEFLTEANLIHIPWTSVKDYTNGMQVDIGCVCVGDTLFSSRKSLIKAWEFAVAGAMVVGSNQVYGQDPIPACENEEDWVKVLSYYINNYESRESLADSYRKFVLRQYDMKYNWVYWPATYESILNICKPLVTK